MTGIKKRPKQTKSEPFPTLIFPNKPNQFQTNLKTWYDL